MSESNYPRTVERVIQVEGKSTRLLAATVRDVSPSESILELSQGSLEPGLDAGDTIRIKCWEEGTLYAWDAEVLEISGPRRNRVRIRLTGEKEARERRRHPRIEVGVPLSFVIIEASQLDLMGKMGLGCTTLDISAGGVAFTTRFPLRVGDKVVVKIDLPEAQVSFFGSVVRCETHQDEDHSVGLEFLQSEPEDQRHLTQFLAQYPV